MIVFFSPRSVFRWNVNGVAVDNRSLIAIQFYSSPLLSDVGFRSPIIKIGMSRLVCDEIFFRCCCCLLLFIMSTPLV